MSGVEEPSLAADGSRVVVGHADPDYGPYVVRAVGPRRCDWWRVLFGRFEPRVSLERRLSLRGVNGVLRRVYGEQVGRMLDEPGPLASLFEERSSE